MSSSDPANQTSIFSLTNHEVYILTSSWDGRENGQIVTWVLPATLVEGTPRIVTILSPQNFTHSLIVKSRGFALNLLAEEQYDLVPLFGLTSGRDILKLDGLVNNRTPGGFPLLADTCGWAECHIVSEIDSGDRIIYLADVTAQKVYEGKKPLHKHDAFLKQPQDIRLLLEEKHRNDGMRDAALMRQFTV